jgi:hypothetical protein
MRRLLSLCPLAVGFNFAGPAVASETLGVQPNVEMGWALGKSNIQRRNEKTVLRPTIRGGQYLVKAAVDERWGSIQRSGSLYTKSADRPAGRS